MLSHDDLTKRLQLLDEEINLRYYNSSKRFELLIAGGSGLALLNMIARSTYDIDALNASREIVDYLEKYDINCRIRVFEDLFPYNYADRRIKLDLPSKRIDFYIVSLEDIVVSKLFAERDTDIRDITSPKVIQNVKWDLLQSIVNDPDEIAPNTPNEYRYRFFLQNYRYYVERYKK